MRSPLSGSTRKSAFEVAYEAIKADILAYRLKPLDPLNEVELAARLGMSRTPIREALRKLEQEGLVWVAPRRGAFVTQISLSEVQEIYFLREVLEGAAAGLAALKTPLEEVDSLIAAAEAVQADGQEPDPARIAELDAAVHELVLRTSGQNKLSDIIHGLNEQALRLRFLGVVARPLDNCNEVLAVLHALKQRNSAQAEMAMRAHIRTAWESLQTAISGSLGS
jgi:DNA-binding GntR family transcriptional regulator